MEASRSVAGVDLTAAPMEIPDVEDTNPHGRDWEAPVMLFGKTDDDSRTPCFVENTFIQQ